VCLAGQAGGLVSQAPALPHTLPTQSEQPAVEPLAARRHYYVELLALFGEKVFQLSLIAFLAASLTLSGERPRPRQLVPRLQVKSLWELTLEVHKGLPHDDGASQNPGEVSRAPSYIPHSTAQHPRWRGR